MIGLVKISSSRDAARYHDNALTEGLAHDRADNYYVDERANLIWQGKAAEVLGIAGEQVPKEQFVAFLDGRVLNPVTGQTQDLGANSKGDERRLGYDFTVSAPKSVSLLGIVGGDERVIHAHVEANRAAMTWLEEHGARVRVKDAHGNNVVKVTGNLLYATVQHETSRANDPQLHNHNVVVAITYDHDAQKWRSLTNDELFQIRTQADTIYKAELARHLREAGYQVAYRGNGVDFEIAGVKDTQLNAFSQRTEQMREALLARGIDPDSASHQARQAAVLNTRARKVEQDRDYLLEIWQEKAREVGLDLATVVEKARQAGPQIIPEEQRARDGVTRAIRHLSEREQSFKPSKLQADAVFFSGGAGIDAVKRAIEDRMEDRSLVERTGTPTAMLTTSTAIANELTFQESIRAGKGTGIAVLQSREQFDHLLLAFETRKTAESGLQFKLSAEQVNAARNVLMHEDKFQAIQGDAGTGKTAALEFVHEVARARGWEVQGIATSTTGARELQQATGIRSQTVAAFLTERDQRIRMLEAERRQLEVDFAHAPGLMPSVKRVAKRDLDMADRDFAPGRYVFDSKSGEVLKASTDSWHPWNTLGIKLQDAGLVRKSDAEARLQKAERFSDRLRDRSSRAAGSIREVMGRSLISYEVVGTLEAKAARAEHREQHVEERARLRSYLTKTAQIENLLATGNVAGNRFLLLMDESSMTGAKDSARIAEIARDMGARVVLQGDIKQHASVAAGRAFQQAQEGGINLSKIEETRRFDQATVQQRQAILEMKQGRYATALEALDTTLSGDLYGTVAARFLENRREMLGQGIAEPKVGIVAFTNEDRQQANKAVREALRQEGVLTGLDYKKPHLDDPKLTLQQLQHVPSLAGEKVDHLTALRDYKSLGIRQNELLTIVDFDLNRNRLTLQRQDGQSIELDPSRYTKFSFARMEERHYAVGDAIEARATIGRAKDPLHITNGTGGVIVAIDGQSALVRWQDGRETLMSNRQLSLVDHAYTHTSYKEQGVTNQREIILVSEKGAHWLNREASYVAASRAKQNTEIVATEVAYNKMLENAGRESGKSTAIDIGRNVSLDRVASQERVQTQVYEPSRERSGPELGL